MSSRHSILTCVLSIAILVGACAGDNQRQLANLQIELRDERALLQETRAELQEVIKKLEPVVAMAELLQGNLEQLTTGLFAGDEGDSHTTTDSPVHAPTEVRVPRSMVDAVMAKPMDAARSARIVPSIKNGKANGFKLYAVRPSSIYAKLGLKNGDTIHTINGDDLSSPEKALEVYTKIRDADVVVLSITRRGKALTHTITIY